MNSVISMSAVIAVALGALIAAPARAALEKSLNDKYESIGFPIGLSIVNIVGSFFAGIVLVNSSGDLQLFLLVGIAGTFTTFSGWVAGIRSGYLSRLSRGRWTAGGWAILVGAGVMLLCVGGAWLGTNI